MGVWYVCVYMYVCMCMCVCIWVVGMFVYVCVIRRFYVCVGCVLKGVHGDCFVFVKIAHICPFLLQSQRSERALCLCFQGELAV